MSFAADVAFFETLARDRQEQVLRVATNEVLNSVRTGSAVTGSQGTARVTNFALEPWRVEVGDTPAVGGGRTSDADNQRAVASFQIGEERSIIGGAVYLKRLEDGHQKQRPAQWVALTIAQWPRIVAYALSVVRA